MKITSRPKPRTRTGFLISAIFLFALGSALAWLSISMPSRIDLVVIDGRITRIKDEAHATKAATIVSQLILVQDGQRVFQLRHEYFPELRDIKLGEEITVFAKQGINGSFWILEVKRGDTTLRTYEQSLAYYKNDNHFPLAVAVIFLLFSVLLGARYVWVLNHPPRDAA